MGQSWCWDRSWRAGTGRGGLGQVVVGLVEAISAVLLDVWGGVSGGRLGCAARQDVSVPGCWPGQAFTPETGRPAGAGAGVGADTSCRAARPSLQRHPISLRPADPARSGRHRGGPHRRLLRRGGARAGGGGIGSELRDLGHPLGSSDRLCLVRGPRYLCEVAADPAAGRAPRQDMVAGTLDRTWCERLGHRHRRYPAAHPADDHPHIGQESVNPSDSGLPLGSQRGNPPLPRLAPSNVVQPSNLRPVSCSYASTYADRVRSTTSSDSGGGASPE